VSLLIFNEGYIKQDGIYFTFNKALPQCFKTQVNQIRYKTKTHMFNPKVLLFGEESCITTDICNLVSSYYELIEMSYEHEFFVPKEAISSSIILILQSSKGEHGIHKLKEIKAAYPGLPALLLLVQPEQSDIINAFRHGAKDVLVIPFKPHELITRLHNLVKEMKANYTLQEQVPNWILKVVFVARSLWRGLFRIHHITESAYKKRNLHSYSLIPMPAIIPENITNKTDIEVSFLGKFTARIKGKSVEKKLSKKAKSLFIYLLYHHNRPIRKDVLMDVFWPFSTQDSAKNCLNVTIHNIRKTLHAIDTKESFLLFEDGHYFINALLNIKIDVELFKRYWLRGQSVEHSSGIENAIEDYHNAISLYKGDFLQNVVFEDWCDPIRENMKETYLAILGRLSFYSANQERYAQTINLSKKMLEKDNCLEEAHRLLMLSYNKLGMRDKAVRQFQKCKESLLKELEVKPSKSTMELFNKIRI
jgi:two-component SAPR family response regulator/CheY-like chemotaxis protein